MQGLCLTWDVRFAHLGATIVPAPGDEQARDISQALILEWRETPHGNGHSVCKSDLLARERNVAGILFQNNFKRIILDLKDILNIISLKSPRKCHHYLCNKKNRFHTLLQDFYDIF